MGSMKGQADNRNHRYDIIPDIHGHHGKLVRLLDELGYRRHGASHRHPEGRKALFLGDYLDRGPEIREVLHAVRGMVEAGDALAILGNHESNALGFHACGPDGGPVRKHSEKNIRNHKATLAAFAAHDAEWREWLGWLGGLPLCLDLGGLRAVHACWGDGAAEVLREASHREPGWRAGDDMTCAAIYFRRPRQALVLTGPPFDRTRDREYAERLATYPGKKILCGGTSAEIASRALGRELMTDLHGVRGRLPPVSRMAGVDLVTEGILTLTAVVRRLEGMEGEGAGDAADQVVEMLRESDVIDLVVGTRINEAHQDPRLPVDLDIRRNLVRRMARVLEENLLKKVNVEFI